VRWKTALSQSSACRGPKSLATVALGPDRLPPPMIGETPGDRRAQPTVKILAGLPGQLVPESWRCPWRSAGRALTDRRRRRRRGRCGESGNPKHRGTAYRKKAGNCRSPVGGCPAVLVRSRPYPRCARRNRRGYRHATAACYRQARSGRRAGARCRRSDRSGCGSGSARA
jgi:hypothetical protein